jgi:hypothetical protein
MEMRKIWLGCMVVIALSSCGNQGKVDDVVAGGVPEDSVEGEFLTLTEMNMLSELN